MDFIDEHPVLSAGGILVSILLVTFLFAIGLASVGQHKENYDFSSYEYVVRQDGKYWYTNGYTEENGCIKFTSNYGTEVTWCEKYQVETNYWKNNNPSFNTVWYGY